MLLCSEVAAGLDDCESRARRESYNEGTRYRIPNLLPQLLKDLCESPHGNERRLAPVVRLLVRDSRVQNAKRVGQEGHARVQRRPNKKHNEIVAADLPMKLVLAPLIEYASDSLERKAMSTFPFHNGSD